jgi:uncharacterized membrane protein
MRDSIPVIVAGIIAWIIVFAFALATDADSKVLYMCAVGIAFGLMGIRYTIRRAKRESN